jgi:photosystem II stability/assembly factor-like uncharacterized protein
MSILTRRWLPGFDVPPDADVLDPLIEEARQRARRRRRWYGACALLATSASVFAYFGFNQGGSGGAQPQFRAELPLGGAAAAAQADASRWTLAPGFQSGELGARGLVFDPKHPATVFAATDGGVYKSANGGRTWRPLDLAPGVSGEGPLAMAPADPKTLYLGNGRGIFKTTDGGATWQATSAEILANETAEERDHRLAEGYVYALVVDRRDPDIVYAGTWEKGVFKTTDGGASWRNVGQGAVNTLVLDPRDPETIYAGATGGYAGPSSIFYGRGVFKSSDGGANWQRVGLQGTNVGILALDPQHPETIYAGTDRKGVVKSTDGGASWRAAGFQGTNVGALMFDPQHPLTLYAGTDEEGAFRTTDGGRTWRALALGHDADLLALHPRNSARLYATSEQGILTSTDAGRSWRATNSGPTFAAVSALVIAPRRPGTAYVGIDHGGVFKRSPDGSWRAVNTGLRSDGVHALAIDPQNPANVYAVTDGGLFKTTTRGASWRRLHVPTTGNSTVAIDAQNPSTVYAITNDDGDDRNDLETLVFRSDDGGATWGGGAEVQRLPVAPSGEISAQPDYDFPTFPLAIDPLDPDTLYAGDLGVFKSTDGGTTWRSAGLARTPVGKLAVDPKEPAIVYAGTDAGLFKSTDAGTYWQALHGPLDDLPIEALAIDPVQPQTVYAGTDRGVFWTPDGGHSWRQFTRLPLRTFGALAIDPAAGMVYAGAGGGGVFELRLGR